PAQPFCPIAWSEIGRSSGEVASNIHRNEFVRYRLILFRLARGGARFLQHEGERGDTAARPLHEISSGPVALGTHSTSEHFVDRSLVRRNGDFSTADLDAIPKIEQMADALRRRIHAQPRWRGIVVDDVKQLSATQRFQASVDSVRYADC